MTLFDITELQTIGVFDRGVPNRERVVIKVRESANMGCYALLVGLKKSERTAVPLRDTFLYFGDSDVNQGDIIVVYTGEGEPTITPGVNEGERVLAAHWGRKQTMFSNKEFVPILVRIEACMVDTFRPADALPGVPTGSEYSSTEFLRLLNANS